jgi:hypothetical protein
MKLLLKVGESLLQVAWSGAAKDEYRTIAGETLSPVGDKRRDNVIRCQGYWMPGCDGWIHRMVKWWLARVKNVGTHGETWSSAALSITTQCSALNLRLCSKKLISAWVLKVAASCPQPMKYMMQLVFLCWGIFLCSTFLYGGYRVMVLLCRMPGGLLHQDPPDHQRKGMELSSTPRKIYGPYLYKRQSENISRHKCTC